MFPHFGGVASFDSSCPCPAEEVGMATRYPPELRRRVLDPIASGRTVADVSRDLGVSPRSWYSFQRTVGIRSLLVGITL
jgi:hypothetical protein